MKARLKFTNEQGVVLYQGSEFEFRSGDAGDMAMTTARRMRDAAVELLREDEDAQVDRISEVLYDVEPDEDRIRSDVEWDPDDAEPGGKGDE